MKHGKWHDDRGYPNDAHRGMLDVDEKVELFSTHILQFSSKKGKLYLYPVQKRKTSTSLTHPVSQANFIFMDASDIGNLYHVR
jgi:hypothetical protein